MAEIIINKERHECPPAVAAYIKELKAENARLEELYQKSVGVIAATDCEECKGKPAKHGEWETHDVVKTLASGKTLDGFCQCSECGDIFDFCFSNHKFCPNCGAKMDGESE